MRNRLPAKHIQDSLCFVFITAPNTALKGAPHSHLNDTRHQAKQLILLAWIQYNAPRPIVQHIQILEVTTRYPAFPLALRMQSSDYYSAYNTSTEPLHHPLRSGAMDRIYLNQTALSLAYIALKRIRALDAPSPRQPASPLLRHIGHIKILAACVEHVGSEEIIEYEINQDYGIDGSHVETPDREVYHVEDTALPHEVSIQPEAVSGSQHSSTKWSSSSTKPLPIITEDPKEFNFDESDVAAERPRRNLSVRNNHPIDFDDEGDYSMDELYDEYNTQEDDWETASEESDDDQGQVDHIPPSTHDQPPTSPRSFKDADTDSEGEEDIPCTPPNVIISRSPPLNITTKHPITHELSKREQYRREIEPARSALSNTFVEQIEDVLCQEMGCLSVRGISGDMRFGKHTNQRVSLFA